MSEKTLILSLLPMQFFRILTVKFLLLKLFLGRIFTVCI